MKITIEFSGRDEMFEAKCALQGSDLWAALSELDSALRNRYKHGNISEDEAAFIEELREITMTISE